MTNHADIETITTSLPKHKQFHCVQKPIYSVVLKRRVKFMVSTDALRMIERMGGLDEYVLLSTDEELGGPNSVGVKFKRELEKFIKFQMSGTVKLPISSQRSAWQGTAFTADPVIEQVE